MKKPSVPAELTRIIKFMLSVGASEETILRSFQNAARGSNEAAGLGYLLGQSAIASAKLPRNSCVGAQ